MKKLLFGMLVCGLGLVSFAQDEHVESGKTVPSVELKNLEGEIINTAALENDGNPIIINFWATWCSPCKRELNTINDLYTDWQDETGVKLYAVSIDDTKTMNNVEGYVNGKAWDYEVLYDPNSDLRRAMGVTNPPHTFIVMDGKIVYSHSGYSPGDEDDLYDKLIELTQKK